MKKSASILLLLLTGVGAILLLAVRRWPSRPPEAPSGEAGLTAEEQHMLLEELNAQMDPSYG